MSDLVGQQWGNYRLTRLLGQGGEASVYQGEHLRLNMFAAIKILRTHLSEKGAEDFQREAQVIAELVHPHLLQGSPGKCRILHLDPLKIDASQ